MECFVMITSTTKEMKRVTSSSANSLNSKANVDPSSISMSKCQRAARADVLRRPDHLQMALQKGRQMMQSKLDSLRSMRATACKRRMHQTCRLLTHLLVRD